MLVRAFFILPTECGNKINTAKLNDDSVETLEFIFSSLSARNSVPYSGNAFHPSREVLGRDNEGQPCDRPIV